MIDAGSACFVQNRDLFSDPKASPEKFNLYSGLASLSAVATDLLLKVEKMDKELQDLKQRLHQHDLI